MISAAALFLAVRSGDPGSGPAAGAGTGAGTTLTSPTVDSATPPASSTPVRARIVTVAESQIGYQTVPSDTYCNKYSYYWRSGTGTICGNGLKSEEWCADFAAWVWRTAGASFAWSFRSGDIYSGAISFYQWAVAHGTWHAVGDGYQPQPGDVAVYGLTLTAGTADHVAVVTGYTPGDQGPDVVNGDGDRGAFSIVQAEPDQFRADAPGQRAPLAGYASPIIK